ncbi:multicopper oxidase family protein [Streptomyces sp. AJS327]|uniref:multicopper oxidase family protein n=1 Tax=Streptomyces sp. AJS327 TaxID=2545265 RepID=UPI0015DFB68E|nr:multicopper oxidase family protein [Streptomyces sp. AJS327]MBA0050101.1 multicopper oxidase family protein [Streptomyces sp. AJS327]
MRTSRLQTAATPLTSGTSRTSRRTLLGAGVALAGTGLLGACSSDDDGGSQDGGAKGQADAKPATDGEWIEPDSKEVRAAEAKRAAGDTEKVSLTATRSKLDLGDGVTVSTWAYDEELPGKEVRVTAGNTLELKLANNLPEATSVHWHGLALRNDMDGVPGLTQRDIKPGADFTYRFRLAHPGTYWFHPHSGVQQDRGLYAPLVIEDPKEPLKYDEEWVVVLDDWVDGVEGSTPDAVLKELAKGMSHGGGHGGGHGAHSMGGRNEPKPKESGPSRMMMGATSKHLGGDAGDVAYPHYLVNGRTAKEPRTFKAKPGDRVRIRLVNAGGDTAFRVALGGHRMTVTHTDGFPVRHRETEALLLGMGERYDVLVTVKDGVFPLTALAEGKKKTTMAVLRTGGGETPSAKTRPAELDGKLVTAEQLRADSSVRLRSGDPDRTIRFKLTGSMEKYDWSINGRTYDPKERYPISAGERVRLVFVNDTEMWHPMHLHGHTFQLPDGGPRKDTAIVLPGKKLEVDFDADNPGLWMAHCHNVYHSESGMMTVLGYRP